MLDDDVRRAEALARPRSTIAASSRSRHRLVGACTRCPSRRVRRSPRARRRGTGARRHCAGLATSAQQRRRVDRVADEPRKRRHPPATGGMIATSSPAHERACAVARTAGSRRRAATRGSRSRARPLARRRREHVGAPSRSSRRARTVERLRRAERVGVRGEEKDGDGHACMLQTGDWPRKPRRTDDRAPATAEASSAVSET